MTLGLLFLFPLIDGADFNVPRAEPNSAVADWRRRQVAISGSLRAHRTVEEVDGAIDELWENAVVYLARHGPTGIGEFIETLGAAFGIHTQDGTLGLGTAVGKNVVQIRVHTGFLPVPLVGREAIVSLPRIIIVVAVVRIQLKTRLASAELLHE